MMYAFYALLRPPKGASPIVAMPNQGLQSRSLTLQGRGKKWSQALVNFVTTFAYHFGLNLPEKFSKPEAQFFTPALYITGYLSVFFTSNIKMLEYLCNMT